MLEKGEIYQKAAEQIHGSKTKATFNRKEKGIREGGDYLGIVFGRMYLKRLQRRLKRSRLQCISIAQTLSDICSMKFSVQSLSDHALSSDNVLKLNYKKNKVVFEVIIVN